MTDKTVRPPKVMSKLESARRVGGQAQAAWSGAEPLLPVAWSKALQPAMGRPVPSTFGSPWASRSQSGSPAEEGTANADARDASILGETAVIPLSTHLQFIKGLSGKCML